jgi:large subunit ribosomal protein L27Ae
MDKYHPG